MRVLFLTQVLPYPLDAGPKVRAYYTLRHLAQRHAVSLLTFVRPNDPPSAVDHLRSICESVETIDIRRGRARDAWHLARSLIGGTPFLIERDRNAEMIRSIRARFSSPPASANRNAKLRTLLESSALKEKTSTPDTSNVGPRNLGPRPNGPWQKQKPSANKQRNRCAQSGIAPKRLK